MKTKTKFTKFISHNISDPAAMLEGQKISSYTSQWALNTVVRVLLYRARGGMQAMPSM